MIGGWLPGEGGRAGRLGALVIGIPDDDGVLRYAGRVGTGFTQAELVRLGAAARAARDRRRRPFAGRQPPKLTRFVEPRLVARVDFTERTQRRHAAPALLQGACATTWRPRTSASGRRDS